VILLEMPCCLSLDSQEILRNISMQNA